MKEAQETVSCFILLFKEGNINVANAGGKVVPLHWLIQISSRLLY